MAQWLDRQTPVKPSLNDSLFAVLLPINLSVGS